MARGEVVTAAGEMIEVVEMEEMGAGRRFALDALPVGVDLATVTAVTGRALAATGPSGAKPKPAKFAGK